MLASLLLAAGAHLLCYGWTCASLNDSDTPQLELKTLETCPGLEKPSRIIECRLNGQKVDCRKPATPGTIAALKCKKFYYYAYSDVVYSDYESTCLHDGSWSHAIIDCDPVCGDLSRIPRIPGYHYWWYLTDKIKNTENTENSMDIPWHAGIYEEIDGRFEQICGGTILSEDVIVTAAHCFWDSVSEVISENNTYRVAVGKIYRDWYIEEENVQFPEIEYILPDKWFRGKFYNWASDVAVIKLTDPILMSSTIRPVCINFTGEYKEQFIPGKVGIIAGWGGKEDQLRSVKLRKLTLPHVALDVCKREVPESFVPFLTEDKFCAGYRNGTSLCPGDGGGGLAIQFSDGKWYLVGIVSVLIPPSTADICNMFQYTLFTTVSEHDDENDRQAG